MTISEAFDLVEVGSGHWDIQLRETLTVVGDVRQTGDGFALYDWLGRRAGTFATTNDALRSFLRVENEKVGRPRAA